MKKNLSSFNICGGTRNKKLIPFETTYNSSYGSFYPEFNNNYRNNNNNYSLNKSINLNNNHLLLNQTSYNIPNSKLICPNCINKNIIRMKIHSRIKRTKEDKINNNNYFEDKMKIKYKNKINKDIKDREERAKQTYYSLFKNRERSLNNYKNIEINKEEEYFGKDIEYGMIRCRNRELKNDKEIFGINLNKKLRNNKSWISKNYLLDKNEYNQIINKQIEKNSKKNNDEKNIKLKEEKNLLNIQLKCENIQLKKEKKNKNNIRYEMNRVNSFLLKEKKNKENKLKRNKKKEKECINNICKKQNEEYENNLKLKKIKNQNILEENLKTVEFKNKIKKREILKNNNNINNINNGILLKDIENKKCEQCNRLYPKNVLSQLYYCYDTQQKKEKEKEKEKNA